MTTIDVSLAALTELVERHREVLKQWEDREQRLDALIAAGTRLVGRQVIAENREALDALAELDDSGDYGDFKRQLLRDPATNAAYARRVPTPSVRVVATVSSVAKQQQGGTLWIEWDSHAHIEDGIPLRDDHVELWGGLIGKQVELVIAPIIREEPRMPRLYYAPGSGRLTSDPPDNEAEQ